MYKPIRDYAIIGNLRSAALVGKDASIDWAPAPFINSESVFAAILDDEKGGFWQIAPQEAYTARQYYDGDSNVLVTQFTTDSGVLEVTDFIPIETEKAFVPAEEDTTFKIHRKVSCSEGECAVQMTFMPRFNYARGETELSLIDNGVYAEQNGMRGTLATRRACHIENGAAYSEFTLKEGESEFIIFRYNAGEVILQEDDYAHHQQELLDTREFWEEWVHRCDKATCPVAGNWHDEAVRSSLVLKILFFEPVGTIAAAPTTSLPEDVGGIRNWDYRFTWIRDSAFTLMALFHLGYVKEAGEYVRWIIELCQEDIKDNPAHLQVMYGLQGEHNLSETTLDHLSGYRDSYPVRIGNRAYNQKQFDIYGSVLDMMWTIHLLREEHHVLNLHIWEILRGFANHVASIWREPDEGLWEVRSGKQHFVYSKVMCWVALDRALKIADTHNLPGERSDWQRERDAIFEEVMERGFSTKKQSFVQSYGSDAVDASALTFATLGFIEPDDERMRSTIRCIEQELGVGGGLLLRYNSDDGLPGQEGAFVLASFWLVDALYDAGETKRAEELFETLLGHANHVGLFSEEIDPATGEFLGNFPQAYTHIGLINSAFKLAGVYTKPSGGEAAET